MKYTKFAAVTLLVFTMVACSIVPLTGRKQMHLVPQNMVIEMGFTNYQLFKDSNKVVAKSDIRTLPMNLAGPRIVAATEAYLKQQGLSDRVEGFKWEFNMFDNPQVNAWALPGGKVAVYTGMLPFTKNEIGMATVLGHEIAHIIAQHGNERLSQQLALNFAGMSLQLALQQQPEKTRNLYLTAYGVGSALGTLAYSRQHEYEADKLGMVFMALAGYDPSKSITFWEDMTANSSPPIPEVLSTHPNDDNRIAAMRAYLPEAMTYYKK